MCDGEGTMDVICLRASERALAQGRLGRSVPHTMAVPMWCEEAWWLALECEEVVALDIDTSADKARWNENAVGAV